MATRSRVSRSRRRRILVRARRGRMAPILIVLLLAALVVAGALPRLARSKAREEERTLANAVPTVYTEQVVRDTAPTPIELPGTVTGLHEASIFARTNGFVRSLRVDIGSVVQPGETLVVLDMPDVREQAQQATAVLEQTEASAALARATLTRWKQMSEKGVVTPQELEERSATANVTEANVRAARANVANLREVLRFGALVAPFRGVVTARSIDIGSLVVAGAATGARPLLTLVQTDTVRVMLQIPQSAASRVHTGMKASIGVRELGDSAVTGTVVRTAGAMDPLTRTLLTEVQVPNASRRLLPGMFANVKIAVPNPRGMVRIPAIALIVRGDGPQVAQVVNDTVHLVPIGLGRDFGTSLEVVRGIAPGAAVVVNPPENLLAGMQVKAIARGAAKK